MGVPIRRLSVLLTAALLAGCGTFADPTEWFSESETAAQPAPLVELQEQVNVQNLWSRDTGAGTDEQRLNLVPQVAGGAVYVADSEGQVQALSADSGDSRWKVELDAPLAGGPGVGEGLVLLGSSDAEVIALSAADGSERWRTRVSSEVLSVPAAANGVVVAQTVDGKVFGLDASSGAERWRYERSVPVLTLRGSSSPVLRGGVVYIGMPGGKLIALRADNGSLLWDTSVAVPTGRSELERLADIDGDPIVMRGGVFAATYQGNVAAVEQRSGRLAWRRKMSSYAGMAADGNGIYLADEDGIVWGLELRNGRIRWDQKLLGNRQLSRVAVIDGYVVVGDFEGYLHWIDSIDGRLVGRSRVGSEPITTGLQVVEGVLYVQGDGGEMTALRVPSQP